MKNLTIGNQRSGRRVFHSPPVNLIAGGLPGFLPLVVVILLAGLLLTGCRRESTPESVPPTPQVAPSDGPSAQGSAEEPEADETLTLIPGLQAGELLRDMIDVYHQSKIYSDRGYAETVYQMDGAPVTYRFPASVTFQKPNYLRMEIGGGILTCDGETIRGKILDPFYDNQILEKQAPLIFSSIKELYPDIKLADAMDLPIPPNIFWVPPQIVLLLAREPLKTLTPDATLRLLEPKVLRLSSDEGFVTKVPCDRVAVQGNDGTRILWISRQTRGLVRMELPIEQIQAPEGVERVLELSMNFPDQVISNQAPTAEESPLERFTIDRKPDDEIVDHFLPVELTFYGKKTPAVRLEPLLSGDSSISLDVPNGRCRVLALWGRGDNSSAVWNRSRSLLRELDMASRMFGPDDPIDFLAVNVDASNRSKSTILSDYGDLGRSFPLYRLKPSDLRRSVIARTAVPSLLFLDSEGVIQKYYSRPVSYVTIQYHLILLKDGKNIYGSDLDSFKALSDGFEKTVNAAVENDVYFTRTDSKPESLPIADPKDPDHFRLEEEWSYKLVDPSNPLLIADAPSDEDGSKKGRGLVPDEAILIPYGGNQIAVLNSEGKPLLNKMTAAGEPVSFLRTIKLSNGERYYAASSFLDTHKIYLFDKSLNLMGTLDVNQPRQQWVADVLLNDENEDNQPELMMALVGDASSNLIPTHGIYSVPFAANLFGVERNNDKCPVFWKDEFVVNPFRIGKINRVDSDEKIHQALLGMNFPVDNMGKLVEDNIMDGHRIESLSPPDDISLLWFATSPAFDQENKTETFAALIAGTNSETTSFAILDMKGTILKETPLEKVSWGDHLERILSEDINGDGEPEWIVPTTQGRIYFFDHEGNLFDTFAPGQEVTGVGVAHWTTGSYLVVTHPTSVVAYKILPLENPSDEASEEESSPEVFLESPSPEEETPSEETVARSENNQGEETPPISGKDEEASDLDSLDPRSDATPSDVTGPNL